MLMRKTPGFTSTFLYMTHEPFFYYILMAKTFLNNLLKLCRELIKESCHCIIIIMNANIWIQLLVTVTEMPRH